MEGGMGKLKARQKPAKTNKFEWLCVSRKFLAKLEIMNKWVTFVLV